MKSLATTDLSHLSMDSLSLPPELYWDIKAEPLYSELFSTDDDLCDDNFANGISLITDDVLELKPGIELSDVLSQELINGEDLVIELCNLKAEHWNDVKLQSPVQLLDYQPGAIISHPNVLTKVLSPFEIGIYGANPFDTAILTQLTPPHSPPQNAAASPAFQSIPSAGEPQASTSLATQDLVQTNASLVSLAPQSFAVNNWNASPSTLVPEQLNDDIAREMQIVDDIVNTRVRELFECNDECESVFSSDSTPSQPESTTDEEWALSSYCSSASSSPLHLGDEDQLSTTATVAPKKRTRPYGRGVEDRKIRKKEQNKNAATRYRQKKKLEMEVVLTEEQLLTQRNDELKRTLTERQSEAKYLKKLIREFYAKK